VERWTKPIPGYTAHFGRIHAASDSLFVADGWGVTFASLRFRRFDLRTGTEVASIRTGTSVRCFALVPGADELVAATDTKLFRLGINRLDERQRWDRRIPRYANTIVLRGTFAVVADWMKPRVSIVDLATGGVRRRDAPPILAVIDGPGDPLLVAGSKGGGGIATIEPRTGVVGPVRAAPPAIDAVVDPDGLSLWMTSGVRGAWSETQVSPGSPTRRLRRQWLDDSRPPVEYALPEGALSVQIGEHEMWLASDDALIALARPFGSGQARIWRAPTDHDIRWVHPDARIAIVVKRDFEATNAMMTAFELA
jgi:hypothetical protein